MQLNQDLKKREKTLLSEISGLQIALGVSKTWIYAWHYEGVHFALSRRMTDSLHFRTMCVGRYR